MTKHSPQIVTTILDGLHNGGSLAELCRENGINKATFYRWKLASADLAQQYEASRSDRADALLDECLEIADDGTNDWMERRRGDGSPIPNHEHIRRSALRIDTRMKLAARFDPKRYDAMSRPVDDEAGRSNIADIIKARRQAIARDDD